VETVETWPTVSPNSLSQDCNAESSRDLWFTRKSYCGGSKVKRCHWKASIISTCGEVQLQLSALKTTQSEACGVLFVVFSDVLSVRLTR
jgi:hypothetical protein